jgi:hypothetical protein
VCVLHVLQLLAEQGVVGPPVGIMPWDTPVNASWFPPEGSDMGLGGVACNALAAEYAARLAAPPGSANAPSEAEKAALMAVLIGRRCRCTHGLPCQKQAEVVERCTRDGRTPYKDV